MQKKLFYKIILLFIFPFTLVFAGQTKYHVMQGSSSFLRGEFQNTQLNSQGHLLLGSEIKEQLDTKDLLIQSMLQVKDGFYIGTAQDEEIYFYDFQTQKETLIYKGDKLSVSGLALTQEGLYFAQLPSNNIYFISNEQLKNGQIVNDPKLVTTIKDVSYIWGLTSVENTLYAITGSKAGLYKIDPQKKEPKSELLWEAKDEKHLITLVSKDDQLYLGAEGKGGVYQFDTKKQSVKTLYTTYEGEVSDIFVDDKNTVYFTTSSKEPKVPRNDFVYTDAFLLQEMAYKMKLSKLLDAKVDLNKALAMAENNGKDSQPSYTIKNSLYSYSQNKINKLFTLDNSSLNSLTKTPDGLIIVGSSEGNVLSYNELDNTVSLLGSVNDEEVIAVHSFNGSTYFATSNLGRLYSLKEQFPTKGEYVSRVMDLGSRSDLGMIRVESQEEGLGNIRVFVRGGQTQTVDQSWEKWDGSFTSEKLKRSTLKGVRYIQYKVEMTGKNKKSPKLYNIRAAFMGDNAQPSISLFNVFYDTQNPNTPNYVLNLQWEASDSDKDKLFSTILFKERGDLQWQTLAELSDQNKIPLDTRLLPDGVYDFKLTVSDELDNAQNRVNKASQVVSNIKVNNTPPEVEISHISSKGNELSIKGSLKSKQSLILKAYYKVSLEGKWKLIVPNNGMYDSNDLQFSIQDKMPLNYKDRLETYVFIRVIDENRNQRVIKEKVKQS